MAKNGKIPTSQLSELPRSWSNRNRQEYLRKDAYESLSRALNRAVADSGQNFQLYDAYRSFEEQVAMLKKNYYPSSGGNRTYNGKRWAKRSGRPSTASPGYSNHGTGLAIDIHPGGIQKWFQTKGRTYGWTWDEGRRLGEAWHFVYNPSLDQMKAEGYLDHAAVQKAVGAEVDGKIGTGTIEKIKTWQTKHGLTADGKVGSSTKDVMFQGKTAPKEEAPAKADKSYKLDRVDSPNAYADRQGHSVKHVTLHWWGTPSGQARSGIVAHLCNPAAEVSAHYVVTKGHVTQLVDESAGSWANGNKTANLESITIEADPNDPVGTLPTIAALIGDIRSRHGDLPIYPHQHWTRTECPGDYMDLLEDLDAMARGKSVSVSAPKKAQKKSTLTTDGRWGTATTRALQRFLNDHVEGAKLKIDGRTGPDTWKALQKYLGHPVVDGLIENQSYKHTELGNGISPNGWEYTGRKSKGSKTMRRLQKWVGVGQDGVVYEGTTKALQRKLNEVM